jgi:alkanesulfonate monooxygenase SsuD/methylene tetrahydromethanopterin reductase-like flavin-dependent oxidoreductase (luciferase family)
VAFPGSSASDLVDGPVPARPPAGTGILLTKGTGPVATWSEAGRALRDLEDAGCRALWFADHLFWGRPMPEALTMCAVAATVTRSCAVGTGVLQLPLRRTPAVAKAAATLQALSGGRFVLGLGVGEHAEEYRRADASFATRGADLDRAVAELRALWRDDAAGGEAGPGGPDEVAASWFRQRPDPPAVPLWFGGRSPRAIARAARVGDGWMPIFVTPGQFTSAMSDLDRALSRLERPAASVTRAVTVIVSVTERPRDRIDALAWASDLWNVDPTRLERFLVTGPVEHCRAVLDEYRGAGADHVSLLLATDEPVAMFRALA